MNVSSHAANMIVSLIEFFEWEDIDYPPYSPDMVSTKYQLFAKVKENLGGTWFSYDKELQQWAKSFLQNLDTQLYKQGITVG